jgi:predicted nucleotidyltransferase
MNIAPVRDPVLTCFRAALEELYGARLSRVVLFGSRARGEARFDSDYDVAVFLDALLDRSAELKRLADEIRREGVDISLRCRGPQVMSSS